jgi:hypothetical protein
MKDFSATVKALFENKDDYSEFTVEDKDKNFFIVNRFLAKKYPLMCQELNHKNMPKDLCLDVWASYIKPQRVPFWFWKSSKKEPVWPNGFKDSESTILMERYDIDKESMKILMAHFKEDVKGNLKYLEELEKD